MSVSTPSEDAVGVNSVFLKAGDLTLDYLGCTITVQNVGPRHRTARFELGSVLHEIAGQGTFRVVLSSRDRTDTVMLKGRDGVEIS